MRAAPLHVCADLCRRPGTDTEFRLRISFLPQSSVAFNTVTCVLQAGALRAALVCAMIMLIASPALVRDLADSANTVC